MNEKIFGLLIAFISLILIIPGCIVDEKESYFEYYYELELHSDINAEVYFPIPYDSPNPEDIIEHNYSKLMEDLNIIEGNGSLSIINTSKGYALKINFTNKIHVVGKKRIDNIDNVEYDNYFFDELTLKNNSDEFFIYSDINNVESVYFICYLEHISSLDSVRQREWKTTCGFLKKGWNSVIFLH